MTEKEGLGQLFAVRLTEKQHQRLDALARRHNRTLSDVARAAIDAVTDADLVSSEVLAALAGETCESQQ